MKVALPAVLEMVVAMAISGTIGWLVVGSGQAIEHLIFWRCLFGALTLLAFCGAMGLLRRLAPRELLLAVLAGVAIVTNWWFLFQAYRHASISIATIAYNTQPFLFVMLAWVFLGERSTRAQLAWLALAFAGLMLVASGRAGGGGGIDGHVTGLLLALAAAMLWALAAVAAKLLRDVPPHLIALVQMATGCILFGPFVLGDPMPSTVRAWSAFATMGIVYTGIVYILLYGAYQKLPTALAATLTYINPIVAVVVDYLVFGVRLEWVQGLGALAILIAAAGMHRPQPSASPLRRHGAAPAPGAPPAPPAPRPSHGAAPPASVGCE